MREFSIWNMADHRVVDEIRRTMPVRMSSPELEDNDEFAQLLMALSSHITEDGISAQLDADLKQAKQQVQAVREEWLQSHVLYQELSALIMNYELKSPEEMNSEDREMSTILSDSLTLAEIGNYLDVNEDSTQSSTLLGLNKQQLEETNPYKQLIPTIQQTFLPEIERRLREKCEHLVKFYFPSHEAGDSKLQLSKAGQLSALLQTDTANLENEKKLLRADKFNRDKQFWLYYEELMNAANILEKLVKTHRLKNQVERDEVTSAWLAAKCDAVCLKIRIFEMELLMDTYNPMAVKALRSIRKSLNQKDETLKKEMTDVCQTLKAYESAGHEFNTLVEQYSHLRNEFENNQWAMKQLAESVEEG